MSIRNEQKGPDCRERFSRDWDVPYGWFRTYNEAMKLWLEGIRLGRPESPDPVRVVYATPERAFADFISPRVEGQVDLPVISMSLSSATFDPSRFRAPREIFTKTLVGDQWQLETRAMPYTLSYNVTVWAKFHNDLDIIGYSLMSRFTPKSYLSVKNRASMISFSGMNDTSNLEPGQDADRILRHDYMFTVEAWMDMPARLVGKIEGVVLHIDNDIDTELDPDSSVEVGFPMEGSFDNEDISRGQSGTEHTIPGVYTSEE